MPAWRQRQDIGPSPSNILVVSQLPSSHIFVPAQPPYLSSQRVPKELISRFVKICPTCQVRRGGSRLTPPNSRRGSPRLDMISRSPKLPSPPMSRRESTLTGHMALERSHADYFGHCGGHNNWIDSQRSVNERTSLGLGSVRTLGVGSLGHLPANITATMDNFASDISVASSHVTYGSGYEPTTHASSSHREF